MKAFKTIMNVLGILLAVVVSFVLAIVLVGTPVVSGAASFFKPDNMSKIIRSMDFEKLLFENETLQASLGEYGPFLDALKDTDVLEEVAGLYVEDMLASLNGSSERHLTADAVQELLVKNMEDIMPVVKAQLGDVAAFLPEEELEAYVASYVGAYGEDIISVLPDINELGLSEDVLAGVRLLGEGAIVMALYVGIAVLSLLLVLLRFPRFKGFIWLGVVLLLSAGVVGVASFGIGGAGALLVSLAGSMAELVAEPILAVLSAAMFKGAGIYAGLAVLFIIVFVVGRKLLIRKA